METDREVHDMETEVRDTIAQFLPTAFAVSGKGNAIGHVRLSVRLLPL